MMKALSVCQPWAWAIIHGPKRIENRTRYTRHRGPLLIHASKSHRYKRLDVSDLLPDLPPWDELVFGALIGVVQVVDCVPFEKVKDDPFACGPWCWVLDKPQAFASISCKGQVNLFNIAVAIHAQAKSNLVG
jgi:hypothetical protein